jgi:hypothetical protein
MENHIGSIIFILAGYSKQMEKFFEHNPGLPSHMPHTLKFADYTDEELLLMLEQLIHKKYYGKMKVEDDIQGLYNRIAVQHLGCGWGQEGLEMPKPCTTCLQKYLSGRLSESAVCTGRGSIPVIFSSWRRTSLAQIPCMLSRRVWLGQSYSHLQV